MDVAGDISTASRVYLTSATFFLVEKQYVYENIYRIICCISMNFKRKPFFEVAIGLLLVAIGFVLWWWSTQLVWILIYPQPLAKTLIESMPFVFWAIGILLVIDGFRRWLGWIKI